MTMKKAKYIVIEGSEGTGKGTQTKIIVDDLRSKGFKVLDTKEPGTPHCPITLELRKFYLDAKYEKDFEKDGMYAREMISQAIRCLHLQNVIFPGFEEYDYIIQDRGFLSGLAYGVACGVDFKFIEDLSNYGIGPTKAKTGLNVYNLYDQTIYFKGNVATGLKRAQSAKQEFETGDAMESRGTPFLEKVDTNFNDYHRKFTNVSVIDVEDKTIDQISQEIFKILL